MADWVRGHRENLEFFTNVQARGSGGGGAIGIGGALGDLVGGLIRQHQVNTIQGALNERVQSYQRALDALETVAKQKTCAVPMTAKITQWSKHAHEKAKASCKVAGLPELVDITENLEDYQVPCDFSVPLKVRCDSGGCQKSFASADLANATMGGNGTKDAAISGRPLRVAILPAGFHPNERRRYFEPIEDSLEFTEEFIRDSQFLELEYSYYSGRGIPGMEEVWNWDTVRNEPRKLHIFQHGKGNDVDLIITPLFELGLAPLNERQSGNEFEIISSDVYLFDMHRRQMYFRKGGNKADQIKQAVREMFSGYLKSIGMTESTSAILSAKVSEGPGSEGLRIAVLPFWGSTNWYPYDDRLDEWFEAITHDMLVDDARLEPGFSFYRDEAPAGVDIGLERVWRLSGTKRTPNETALAQIGSGLSADGFLLLRYHLFGSNFDSMRDVEILVFDVSTRRIYSTISEGSVITISDREDKVRLAIRSALSKFLAGHH
ncbi:MAG TPA: hypothetical protein VGB36_03005 [Gammaproteobacteria bacterium]